jgi:hypothetical protein
VGVNCPNHQLNNPRRKQPREYTHLRPVSELHQGSLGLQLYQEAFSGVQLLTILHICLGMRVRRNMKGSTKENNTTKSEWIGDFIPKLCFFKLLC